MKKLLKTLLLSLAGLTCLATFVLGQGNGGTLARLLIGKVLFEDATFDGNGRTCQTCHSVETGTLSPDDVQKIFSHNRHDVLFVHDGSDDGLGGGTKRIRKNATILITIPLPKNVSIAGSDARSVVLRRGIPTLQNTPALDPVLMLDGRQPTLEEQAAGAIHDHAQGVRPPEAALHAIAEFEKTSDEFFSSFEMRRFARGGPAPALPQGFTRSEKRGRRFFEDVPPNPEEGFKPGLCAHCHSGPLLNQTNEFAKDFIGLPIPVGQRFISINVSEFNDLGNPVQEFVFDKGTPFEFHFVSPDPGRALITGVSGAFDLFVNNDPTTFLLNVNAFKIPQLRGIRNTAPYFHDNSSKTLEDVAAHYKRFFETVTNGAIVLTPQDQKDIVAFMKLLD
jgi:cytochrome c peroxidase